MRVCAKEGCVNTVPTEEGCVTPNVPTVAIFTSGVLQSGWSEILEVSDPPEK